MYNDQYRIEKSYYENGGPVPLGPWTMDHIYAIYVYRLVLSYIVCVCHKSWEVACTKYIENITFWYI